MRDNPTLHLVTNIKLRNMRDNPTLNLENKL